MYEYYKNILIIQFRPVGDVLLCTPLISILRKCYPEAHIAFMVEPLAGQILENNPHLNEIIYYRHKKDDIFGSMRFFRETGKRKWDLVIDTFGTPGTAWATFFSKASVKVGYDVRIRKYAYTHTVSTDQPERYSALKKLALLKAIGIQEELYELTLRLKESERTFGDTYFHKSGFSNTTLTVCFAPASKRETRAWRRDGWVELGDILMERFGANIVLVWGPGEEGVVKYVAENMKRKPFTIPLTNLREMAAIIEKSDLMITNSSGPGHIAAAVGVPTITVHGPTTPVTWTYPDDRRHKYVQGDVSCIECNRSVCLYPLGADEHMQCMEAVLPEHIVERMKEIADIRKLFPAGLSAIE